MNKKVAIKLGDRSLNVTLLSLFTLIQMAKSPFIYFGDFLHIRSVVLIVIWGLFFASIVLYTYYIKKISYDGILLVLLAMFFFYVTLRLHPEYSDRFDAVYFDGVHSAKSLFSLGGAIYSYHIFRLFKDDEEGLYQTIKLISYSTLIFELFGIFAPSEKARILGYNMGLGYSYEIAAILFLVQYFHENKAGKFLVYSLICEGMAVLFGSRGSIIGYVFL